MPLLAAVAASAAAVGDGCGCGCLPLQLLAAELQGAQVFLGASPRVKHELGAVPAAAVVVIAIVIVVVLAAAGCGQMSESVVRPDW